jgi:starch-binding outer membrane protein, SusD/RagB family
MKAYKINTRFVLILSLVLLFSCNEDRLDLLPLGVVGDETFFATPDGPYQALYGVYRQLQYDGYSGTGEVVMGSCTSDDAEFGGEFGGGDQPEIQDICYFRMTSTTPLMRNYWTAMYQGIQRASTIIHKLPTASGVLISASEIDQIVTEARCLRAFFYFELNKAFGGVVVYDNIPDAAQITSIKRSTIKETFNFIEEELLDVADKLPDTRGTWKVTRGFANAVLAKMYLFESSYAKNYPGDARFAGCVERWEKVQEYTGKVINSPAGYELVGMEGQSYSTLFDENTNALMYMWTVEGENSPESIFEVQFIHDTRPLDQRWLGASQGDLGAVLTGQCSRYFPSQGVRWWVTKEGTALNKGGEGFGYNCPTQDFMDEMNTYFDSDPRINWWVGRPGDSIWVSINGIEQWVYMDFRESPTGMNHKKCHYIHPNYRGPNWDQNAGNIRLIRLADVILWAAEAEYHLGNEPAARAHVNKIRARARSNGAAANLGQPADFTSPITFYDIVRERRIELCFESHRYWDLVRWRLAEQEISGLETRWAGQVFFEPGKHEFYPIPQYDIDKSEGSIVQNPWY